MNSQRILSTIYEQFANWCEKTPTPWACQKGCSCCCTQNVTITTQEGQVIIDGLNRDNRLDLLNKRLAGPLSPTRPRYTFNTMARACLAGKTLPAEEVQTSTASCPFLENSCCTIYPFRPFSCRSFLSKRTCAPDQPAEVDDAHLAATTAIGQLLEHLSQRQPWGNMLDLLPLLLSEKSIDSLPPSPHVLRAQPMPGFLLGPEVYDQVAPLIEAIFATRVDSQTIEDILNGA